MPTVTSRVPSTWASAGTPPRPYLPSPLPTLALTYLPPSSTLTLTPGTNSKMAPTFTKAEVDDDTSRGGRAEAYDLFLRYEAWKAAYNAYDVMDAVRHFSCHTMGSTYYGSTYYGSTYYGSTYYGSTY